MKVKVNGKWHKLPLKAGAVAYSAEGIRLGGSDLKKLSGMSDRDLCATVRQLSGRVNRYHSGGFTNNPTGRAQSWPDIQFISPRTGRWPVGKTYRDGKVEPLVFDESHYTKPNLAEVDFADIEKRVIGAFNLSAKQMGTAETQRQLLKKIRHAKPHYTVTPELHEMARKLEGMFAEVLVDVALDIVQNDVDEEGCGAVWSAFRYQRKDHQ